MTQEQSKALIELKQTMSEEKLWDAIVAFQNEPLCTVSGLPFKYELNVGKNGTYTRELIVNRREGSKSLVLSSVLLAFRRAKELEGEIISRPKALGDIRGISYIYPMLYRFGVIEIPEKFRHILDV